MTTYSYHEQRDTDREATIRALAAHLRNNHVFEDAPKTAQDWQRVAIAAFDLLAGDVRMPGRHFHPERRVTVTIHATGNRTVRAWGQFTGWTIDETTNEITALELTRAHVYDGGLRETQMRIRGAWSDTRGGPQRAYEDALDVLALLQPEDPASTNGGDHA